MIVSSISTNVERYYSLDKTLVCGLQYRQRLCLARDKFGLKICVFY